MTGLNNNELIHRKLMKGISDKVRMSPDTRAEGILELASMLH